MLSVFSFSKCSLFHNSIVFGSCIIHILYVYRCVLKFKKNSGSKRLKYDKNNNNLRDDLLKVMVSKSLNFF